MDGSLIDSTDAIVKHWHKIGKQLGVDPNTILATSHGRRSIDVLKLYDPSLATWECEFPLTERFQAPPYDLDVLARGGDEDRIPTRLSRWYHVLSRSDESFIVSQELCCQIEILYVPTDNPFALTLTPPLTDVCHVEGLIPKEFGRDAVEIPGARTFLDRLEEVGARWAIVTSGTRPLVTGWLDVMNLAHPKNLVCAEMVENGKPDPACYLLGHSMLGVPSGEPVLVLEDAPSGVLAGKAAGFKVVALATTHTVDQLKEAGADWIVRDMRSVTLKAYDNESGQISIEISDALQE
ncbi:DL-glycerol-3-phosphatase [Diplodia seriata]|uniref:DL-glycerol-3-phosphatase n=1 Tax=Diplodia seriata TaxID=420778 RepID=A0ABR3CNE0_9PEZI